MTQYNVRDILGMLKEYGKYSEDDTAKINSASEGGFLEDEMAN